MPSFKRGAVSGSTRLCMAGGVTLVLLVFVLSKMWLPTWIPARGQQMLHALHLGLWPPSSQWGRIIVLTGLLWGLESVWTGDHHRGAQLNLLGDALSFLFKGAEGISRCYEAFV